MMLAPTMGPSDVLSSGAVAHAHEQGLPADGGSPSECPESSETSAEDPDAKHLAAWAYDDGLSASFMSGSSYLVKPRQRRDRPFVPPPNVSASLA